MAAAGIRPTSESASARDDSDGLTPGSVGGWWTRRSRDAQPALRILDHLVRETTLGTIPPPATRVNAIHRQGYSPGEVSSGQYRRAARFASATIVALLVLGAVTACGPQTIHDSDSDRPCGGIWHECGGSSAINAMDAGSRPMTRVCPAPLRATSGESPFAGGRRRRHHANRRSP